MMTFNKLTLFIPMFILLAACQRMQPPLPTIVAAKPTATIIMATPTVTPTQTAVRPSEATLTPELTQTTMIPILMAETAAPPLKQLKLALKSVASGFTKPLYLTHAQDERLFVVEQTGQIKIMTKGVVNPVPFLDIHRRVGSSGNEQGLLSLAFHPNYQKNGLFYLNYTNLEGSTTIARYNVSADPNVADEVSEQILLTIPQPYANHNGGHILFGPDGYLYIGMGDGGAANDPNNNGQSLNTLLGKILRLDVDNGAPYGVPQDNPFITTAGARPEIWSFGWRNPWRMAFDAATGDLYVADVGQNLYEEVDVELAGSGGGQNYGWRLMEASHCFNPTSCDPAALKVVMPKAEYSHSEGCSITGGYVYRGAKFPQLNGVYIYGDYCTGTLWGLRHEVDGSWSQAELLASGKIISSFGLDAAGELYLIDHRNGEVWQVSAE